MKSRLIILFAILLGVVEVGQGERIKDIVDIQGVRSNPLMGLGLVVGLDGTGDKALASQQMLTNILRDAGVVVSPSDIAGGSIALVVVTAELGPFAREGSLIDVDVSAVGDAKSLQGGMLLPTPLEGLDDQVYAVAQGGVSIGGWAASGDQGSITKNHQTVGRIPGGATVEKAELAMFVERLAGQRFITLNLRNSDFSTAQRISVAINQPDKVTQTSIAAFIDEITKPEVTVDVPAVVVINERTGTIVVGENVGISEVAISQGSLVVKIRETASVSQPAAPFSDAGDTAVVPETMIGVEEKKGHLIPVPKAITVSELANALNAIGATPRDLIAIFNALKKAGALQARLEIM
jgi:flagellar P-ring protein precursor FlgI